MAELSTLAPLLNAIATMLKGIRGEVTTLADAANISIDMDDSNNFKVTLDGNRTLDNPTNMTAGQSGTITAIQDDTTGSRTLSYGSYYEFPGGTVPTLSTAVDSQDILAYFVKSTTEIHISFIGDSK
jgi:preprotein translocase subunit YajC